MILDKQLLDKVTAEAKASPRLRKNFDLRTSPEDGSQRMLNAIEPGTFIPVHRHTTTNETVILLRGHCIQYFYNDAGEQIDAVDLNAPGFAMVVEPGLWHRLDSLESGTVIFECKNGPYTPPAPEDILDINP